MSYGREATAVAEAGRKEILALMKSRGYTQTTSRQSALYQTDFKRDGEERFAIDGWHGTGSGNRNYGTGKTIFSLYDRKSPGYKPVVGADDSGQDHATWTKAQQEKRLAEILAYLRANA